MGHVNDSYKKLMKESWNLVAAGELLIPQVIYLENLIKKAFHEYIYAHMLNILLLRKSSMVY